MDIRYLKNKQDKIAKDLLVERVDKIDDLSDAKILLKDILLDLYDVRQQLDELRSRDPFHI